MSSKHSTHAPSSRRVPTKLSSGILGMKFMQKEETAQSNEPAELNELASKVQPNRFVHEMDPGAWFGPKSEEIKNLTKQLSKQPSTTTNYSDLFAETPVNGRKSFGPKPATVDVEDMVTSSSSKNVNASKHGKKRRSDEGLSKGGNHNFKTTKSVKSRPAKQRRSL